MKILVKKTKRKTYLKAEQIFQTNNDWNNKEFIKVNMDILDSNQIEALECKSGWYEIGDFNNLEDAYCEWINILIQEREERKLRDQQDKADKVAKFEELKKMDVIPSTIENIKIVLETLNNQNWGIWELPKMSIGYSAHQYDCEGSMATTMTLDQPVDGDYKFMVGGKRGHLTKYRLLR